MMDYGAIGQVAIMVKFTQQFILDEFLRSVDMTEDEYNDLMNQKEPEYDSRYSDEEWDAMVDRWIRAEDKQQEILEAKSDFEKKVNIYNRIIEDDLSRYENLELVHIIEDCLIKGKLADEELSLDGHKCSIQQKEDNIDECYLVLLISVDSNITVSYGYEGDPEIGVRGDCDWDVDVQLLDKDLVVALNDFFRKICRNTAGIKVISAQMNTQDTKWKDYWN